MGTRRIPIVVCMVSTLVLGACGSDENKSSSSSTVGTNDITDVTATTTVGLTPATIAPAVPTTAVTATTLPAVPTTVIVTSSSSAPRVVTSPSDNVKVGDSGDGVKQIQQALKDKGYQVTVDGQFGNQTATAVKAFQKKNGLKQDGVVGPKTWAKLSSASSSGSGSGDATTTTG